MNSPITIRESGFEELLQNIPVAMYTTDARGAINGYNEAAVALWGREPAMGMELYCGSWKIFLPDGSLLPPEACPMAITLREKRAQENQQIIIGRPDGTKRTALAYPRPIYGSDGKFIGAVNTLVDVTEFRQTQQALQDSEQRQQKAFGMHEKRVEESSEEVRHKNQALKRSEEKYHKMIEEVEDYAIILLDRDGVIQNWNRGAERIKGYTEEEIVGKNFKIFYLPVDQQAGLPERLIGEATVNGKAVHEGWRVRKDGTTFWGSIVITALHDDRNSILGFSKVTRDLTERKEAENKMQAYAAELESQNKELQQFAYAAAHDMAEPLRKIQYYNSAVLEGAGALLPDKEKSYLERAAQAALRMKGLIDDLLSYTRVSTVDERNEPAELDKILEEVKLSHQETIEKTGAVVASGPLPVVDGIPFQLRQLFDNLLGNALKYRHPSHTCSVKITAEKLSRLPDGIRPAGAARPYYKISFRDNGIGFKPEYAEIIFEMFERLHGRENYPGTGIGLSICKKIVQNHHGFIRATGMPGEGAQFDIYLPARYTR